MIHEFLLAQDRSRCSQYGILLGLSVKGQAEAARM